MSDPIAYLRDLDGTGSLHPCACGDPGAFPVWDNSGGNDLDLRAVDALLAENKRLREMLGKREKWACEDRRCDQCPTNPTCTWKE